MSGEIQCVYGLRGFFYLKDHILNVVPICPFISDRTPGYERQFLPVVFYPDSPTIDLLYIDAIRLKENEGFLLTVPIIPQN